MKQIVENNMGLVVWLCGLAGSGKSTLGSALAGALRERVSNVVYLDGDEFRELVGHYSYDRAGRIEVALKYAKFAHFLSAQGQVVVVATISMFSEIYAYNRKHLPNYLEVHVECDFNELKARDQKGLYSGALSGEIKNVVGVDLAFDTPQPDLVINNSEKSQIQAKIEKILARIAL